MLLGLEASEEIDQERVPDAVHCLEDPLLTHQTVEQNAASHCHGGKLAHMFPKCKRYISNPHSPQSL